MTIENIIRAEARKYEDETLQAGYIRYDVWFWTDVGLENVVTTYQGEPSKRQWNLAQQIASKLTKYRK